MELPKQKLPPTRINPKILLIYGIPKVGKTKMLTLLDKCLHLDLEDGASMYECLRVAISESNDITNVANTIIEDAMKVAKASGTKPVYPYKYIAVDTVDKLEDIVEVEETAKLRKKTAGTKDPFTGTSITELAYGAGYGYIREGVKTKIDQLAAVCEYLILVSHVKDKYLDSKNGIDVTEKDLSLSGKLGSIIAAKADAIGYMYRSGNTLRISFKSIGTTVRGGRFEHLAGKDFEFDWDKIYLPVKTV